MKLHFAPNTIAVASVLALNEIGADYTLVSVDFASAQQKSDAYLSINPKGRVPALETDHGILTETIAILEYAAPGLIPEDPWHAAKMREVMTYLASTAHVNHAHKMRGARWADQEASFDDMRRKVPQTMTETAAYLEAMIEGPFVMGDQVTLADCYLYPIAMWMPGDGVALELFPKLSRYVELYGSRPAVNRARVDGVLT
ncbi:MAG: glutathione S-transferase family protein [Pseudomonadota bacterium]